MKALLSTWGAKRRGGAHSSSSQRNTRAAVAPAGDAPQARASSPPSCRVTHGASMPSRLRASLLVQVVVGAYRAALQLQGEGNEAGAGPPSASHDSHRRGASGGTRGRASLDVRSLSESVDTMKLNGAHKARGCAPVYIARALVSCARLPRGPA